LNIHLFAILLYLSALVAAAYRQSRNAQTGDDFLVAGRGLPAHVLVFTLLSAWIGSGSLFGSAGLGYRVGLPALWQPAGAWLGIAVVVFIASRVRRLAFYTVPDILAARFGSTAGMLASITIVIAYTTIAGYQFRGGGRLLAAVSGIDPIAGAIIAAAFCIAFTALAGMRSIAHLDVANGLMMIAGVAVAFVYLLGQAGGVSGAAASLRPDQLTVFGALSPPESLALFLPTLLLLLGDANMYQKVFSARDERHARFAVAGWIVGTSRSRP
jgi:SSS family solute:Na+ symporter/sodium/proline symporter